MIGASAPGKLMLFGEHSVLYGGSCIATAVDLRYTVELEEIDGRKIIIETPETRLKGIPIQTSSSELLSGSKYETSIAFLQSALKSYWQRYGKLEKGLHISTNGPIVSYGLGSSSAITVATIYALFNLFDIDHSKTDIFTLAYDAVLNVQGDASGYDVASAIWGGTIFYKKSDVLIKQLHVSEMPIVLAFTGSKASTINYIQHVSSLYNRQRPLVEKVFELINQIVFQAKEKIEEKNWWSVGELANICQGLLDAIGINTMQLVKPVFAARDNGAWGAKLSGAGGGDCMFAIVDKTRRRQVEEAIQTSGANVLSISVGVEGVKLI